MNDMIEKPHDKCLICGADLNIKTNCVHQESYCINGHVYHLNPANNEIHEGVSWHEKPTCGYSTGCCANSKVIGKYEIIDGKYVLKNEG